LLFDLFGKDSSFLFEGENRHRKKEDRSESPHTRRTNTPPLTKNTVKQRGERDLKSNSGEG